MNSSFNLAYSIDRLTGAKEQGSHAYAVGSDTSNFETFSPSEAKKAVSRPPDQDVCCLAQRNFSCINHFPQEEHEKFVLDA